MPSPSLLHSFLHKYNPIPVDFFPILPLLPVKPLSNTLAVSLSLIPIPLSLMDKTTRSFCSFAIKWISAPVSFLYLIFVVLVLCLSLIQYLKFFHLYLFRQNLISFEAHHWYFLNQDYFSEPH